MTLKRTFIVLTVSVAGLCLFATSAVSQSNFCQPRFVSESDRNQDDLVLVFVHGVFGECESSWTNPRNGRYWPEMVGGDDFFRGADVYVYYYPTELDSAPSIEDLASLMMTALWKDGVTTKYRQIAFVAHSLGGLVVRAFIRSAIESAEDIPEVRFMYLLGTPHTRLEHRAARFLADTGNDLFRDLTGQTTFLSDLMDDWKNSQELSELRDYCAHELKKVRILGWGKFTLWGRKIVHEKSASVLIVKFK